MNTKLVTFGRTERRIGRVEVDPRLILGFLQFPNGEITHIELNPERQTILVTIADNEMPLIKLGEILPFVTPYYKVYEDCEGHRVAVREPL